MTPAGRTPARSRFYLVLAIGGLAVALTGFSTTFFIPSARGEFRAPLIVHLHGALSFSWLLLFIAQAQFVRARRVAWHRRAGYAGAVLAAGMAASGVAVGYWATRRDLAAGLGDMARGQFVNILLELLVFASLVMAAVWQRRDREWHKRLLVLATISVLGPAWFRFRHLFPAVPDPVVTFSLIADSMLLVAVGHDVITTRRVHPAYLWVGPLMVVVHLLELFASASRPWIMVGRALLGEPGP